MSQTYSTRQREQSGSKIWSTRLTTAAAAPAPAPAAGKAVATATTIATAAVPAVAPAAPPVPAVPEQAVTLALTGAGLPAAQRLAPGASGTVTLKGLPGQPWTVSGTLTGLAPLRDPAQQATLWLIHDLNVPVDLAPVDLAQLSRGASYAGNQPGGVFTVDGNPPTYGSNSNTISVAIAPGHFVPGPGGAWELTAWVDAAANQAFHPLVVLGPAALADINTPLPSGTVARILTDLFMRPATVHPELSLSQQYPQRLKAVVQDVLAAGAPAYLDPAQFTRAAVTLEGLVRGTPRLMPTRESCFLISK